MSLRYAWIVMGVCFGIACNKGGGNPPAWVEIKGKLALVVPYGDGNVVVVVPQNIAVCPKDGSCVPPPNMRDLTRPCPACDGCDCRVRACSPWCRPVALKELEGRIQLDLPTPAPTPGPGPDPAPRPAPPTNK
jgi:hypothetical protein